MAGCGFLAGGEGEGGVGGVGEGVSFFYVVFGGVLGVYEGGWGEWEWGEWEREGRGEWGEGEWGEGKGEGREREGEGGGGMQRFDHLLTGCTHRSLVYVEGDCSMNKFQGKDGTAQSALSIVQSRLFWIMFLLSVVCGGGGVSANV